jgi:hypothetical protein
MISGNLRYLLTNKMVSRVPGSERYSNKETIQNKVVSTRGKKREGFQCKTQEQVARYSYDSNGFRT